MDDRPATLADLHRERYPQMVRLATLLLGSEPQAEEVVQDCFVRLCSRFDRLEDPAAYLRASVVNACRSTGRRRAVERDHFLAEQPGVAELDARELLDALTRVSPRQRAALVLRFYEDLPGEEIAQVLGCRPGTVKSLIHRGLERLREELKEP